MSDVFAARRARVLAALGADGALIVAAGPELVIGADTDVRYVPSADIYYLTGYTEPEAVLVLCSTAGHEFTMFVRPRDDERELWSGVRGGIEAARAAFGADAAFPVAELAARLPQIIAGASTLYAPLDGVRRDVDEAISSALRTARRSRPRTGRGAHTATDPHVLLAPMRVRKDATEIEAIRNAAALTVAAFHDAARALPGARHEYEIEAAIEYGFRRRGAAGPAFPTIAAAGASATVLHYASNNALLRKGDLLLLDAGARLDMYCADITRTFPVGGRFTADQRALYDVVLAAHDAVISCIAPGRSVADLDDAAHRVLARGLLDLGLLTGSIESVMTERTWRRYFPHRVSHWLGLDVHDAGEYATAAGPVALEEGMVLTVEPGLYVRPDDASAPPQLRGAGIRLEDDVLVTARGADVLTSALPIAAADVETLSGG